MVISEESRKYFLGVIGRLQLIVEQYDTLVDLYELGPAEIEWDFVVEESNVGDAYEIEFEGIKFTLEQWDGCINIDGTFQVLDDRWRCWVDIHLSEIED